MQIKALTLTRSSLTMQPVMASLRRIAILVVTIVIGAIAGVLVSQYMPLISGPFGGFGAPWSPARMASLPIHVVIFALVGLVLGLLVLAAKPKEARKDEPPR